MKVSDITIAMTPREWEVILECVQIVNPANLSTSQKNIQEEVKSKIWVLENANTIFIREEYD